MTAWLTGRTAVFIVLKRVHDANLPQSFAWTFYAGDLAHTSFGTVISDGANSPVWDKSGRCMLITIPCDGCTKLFFSSNVLQTTNSKQ